MPAAGRELAGIGKEVQQHLEQEPPVRLHRRAVCRHLRGKGQVARADGRFQDAARLLDHVGDIDRLLLQLHAPGLDLGQVEHVVDKGQQVAGRLQDRVDVLRLLLVEAAEGLRLQQLREADDGIQRRAQLVAHAGQEGGLGAVGLLGLRLRQRQVLRPLVHLLLQVVAMAPQLGLGPAQVGQIVDDAGEDRRTARADRTDRKLDRKRAAIGAPRGHLAPPSDDPGRPGVEIAPDMALVAARVGLGHQQADAAPDHLRRAIAEQPLRTRIERADQPVGVNRHDAVDRGVDDRPEVQVAVAGLLDQEGSDPDSGDDQRTVEGHDPEHAVTRRLQPYRGDRQRRGGRSDPQAEARLRRP